MIDVVVVGTGRFALRPQGLTSLDRFVLVQVCERRNQKQPQYTKDVEEEADRDTHGIG